jgi:hypothetical protein
LGKITAVGARGSGAQPSEEDESGESAGPAAREEPPSISGVETPAEAMRPGGGKRPDAKIKTCEYCHGVYRSDELFSVATKKVCETCLPRAEKELQTKAIRGEPTGHDQRKGVRYLKDQLVADRLRKEGRSTSYGSIKWPKCYRHPERSTKDVCALCDKPVCAMCSRRRGQKVYCPGCIGKVSGISSRQASAKFVGFTGSYFETVKEVLFSPSVFFRNLPSKGEILRPFLFALINWLPGNGILFLAIAFVLLRTGGMPLDFSDLHLLSALVMPVIYGVLIISAAFAGLGWIPFHVFARLLGGSKVKLNKGFRMFSLASAVSVVNVIPFAGAALSPLFAAVVLIRAVSEVYELDLIRAFLAFLLSYALLIGAVFGLARFYVFSGF